jgi:hypothetical protein
MSFVKIGVSEEITLLKGVKGNFLQFFPFFFFSYRKDG